jgi:heat-inducible transcriptional repressor
MFLDERKQKILGAVVRDYVESMRPIGSEELVQRHDWGVKSATIRHELAELAELGYLRQPHTSAGRIPSDRGYRFYVDHLMVGHRVSARAWIKRDEHESALELDRILRLTCSMLTQYTSYTSVATAPRPTDTTLTHVLATSAGDGRMLIVVLFSTGQVENRLLSEPHSVSTTEIVTLNNLLKAAFCGKTLQRISTADDREDSVSASEQTGRMRALFELVASVVRQVAASIQRNEDVVLEGTREMLRQPEFRDIEKLEPIMETFHGGPALFEMLSRTVDTEVTVVIGQEHAFAAMQECSIITAPYYTGISERGTIGVVGPTRMDYDRAVPAVNYFAHSLSQTLVRFGKA